MPRGFLALIIFIGALAVLGLLVWPSFQEFREVSGQAKEIQAALEQRERYFERLSRVFNNLEQKGQILEKFDQTLPNEFDPDRLIYILHLFSRDSGLILNEIEGLSSASLIRAAQAQSQGGQFGLKEIQFSAKLTGSYPAFKNFLTQIEQSARLFEVQSLAVVPGLTSDIINVQQSNNPTLRFDIKLKAHSY